MRIRMIPGFTLPPSSWDAVHRFFDPQWDAEAFEIPDGLDFSATAEALGHRGGKGVWMGYSLGARLALRIAVDHPETVERLILVSGTAGIDGETARRDRRAADHELAASIETNGVDIFLEQWLNQRLFETLPANANLLSERKRVATVPGLTHQLRVLGQGVQDSLWDRLGQLKMPVLILVGQWDLSYTRIATRLTAAIGPTATLVVIPEAGHSLPLEQPAAVAHAVTEWLGATE